MADNRKEGLQVVQVVPENHDTTTLVFTGPEIDRFKARAPGQFATIRVLRDGGWTEPHPFTLSCAPEDDALRMTIKQSGAFTSTIANIAPGTPIQCAGPFGQFCRGIDAEQEIVMIAGGVGITPFLSVLRHFRGIAAKNRMVLFWANKTPADAFAADELEDMTHALPLAVVHVFSRVEPEHRADAPAPEAPRPGSVQREYGRLTQEIFRRHIRTLDAAFYLCGPPAMQEAMLAELAKCGVDAAKIQKEAFVFKAPNKS